MEQARTPDCGRAAGGESGGEDLSAFEVCCVFLARRKSKGRAEGKRAKEREGGGRRKEDKNAGAGYWQGVVIVTV